MGGKGSGNKGKGKASIETTPLAAQGTGGKKRTPQSAFDPAKDQDIYEPEKIVAERMAKGGVTQYQVKWKGWVDKHNTWAEPIEHLAGCEDMIAEMKERRKQKVAELEAAAAAALAAKQEEKRLIIVLEGAHLESCKTGKDFSLLNIDEHRGLLSR